MGLVVNAFALLESLTDDFEVIVNDGSIDGLSAL